MVKRLALLFVLLANLAAVGLMVPVVSAGASPAVVVVAPGALNGWETQTDSTASVVFGNGPATPPLGTGSVQLSVGSDGDSGAQVRYLNAVGTRLDQITALSYSTYVSNDSTNTSSPPDQAPYMTLVLDNNGDNVVDDALFFEPVYQDGTYGFVNGDGPITPQGPIALNTWQTWDALAGGWWANADETGGPPLHTIAGYIALHPNARIINTDTGRGGLRVAAGFGAGSWDNFVGNVDNLTFVTNASGTTYDFELGKDLAITKSANASSVAAGAEFTYTLTVVNAGSGDAIDVAVADTLPNGTTFVSCTASNGGVCGGTGSARTVNFASLPSGTTATIFITVSVGAAVPDGTVVTNTANVTSYGVENNPTNNTSTATVTISHPCTSPFADVSNSDLACAAIVALTDAGIIQGYNTNPATFGPQDQVQRAQMAAFIVRALHWENRPTGPRTFNDFGSLTPELVRDSLILANACDNSNCVAKGYGDGRFGPNNGVTYAEVIAFITRAQQINGTWQEQAGATQPYTSVPAAFDANVRTYNFYVGTIPDGSLIDHASCAPSGTSVPPACPNGWNSPASRAWVARVLYQALQSQP